MLERGRQAGAKAVADTIIAAEEESGVEEVMVEVAIEGVMNSAKKGKDVTLGIHTNNVLVVETSVISVILLAVPPISGDTSPGSNQGDQAAKTQSTENRFHDTQQSSMERSPSRERDTSTDIVPIDKSMQKLPVKDENITPQQPPQPASNQPIDSGHRKSKSYYHQRRHRQAKHHSTKYEQGENRHSLEGEDIYKTKDEDES